MPEATSLSGFIVWGAMWFGLLHLAAWGMGAIGQLAGLI